MPEGDVSEATQARDPSGRAGPNRGSSLLFSSDKGVVLGPLSDVTDLSAAALEPPKAVTVGFDGAAAGADDDAGAGDAAAFGAGGGAVSFGFNSANLRWTSLPCHSRSICS